MKQLLFLSLLLPLLIQGQDTQYFIYKLHLSPKYTHAENWDAEAEAKISSHAAMLDSLGRAGKLIFAGPMGLALDDPNMFGIALLRATSLEEAKSMVAGDAAVHAGIQIANVFPFRMAIKYFENVDKERKFPMVQIQNNAIAMASIKEINKDIWTPFAQAYASSNAASYLNLFSPDFIRSWGGENASMQSFAEFKQNITQRFNWTKSSKAKVDVEFSFFERSANEETASEKGIIRYSQMDDKGTNQYYYVKFHALHRKVKGIWKIGMWYDEDAVVDEKDFEKGVPR